MWRPLAHGRSSPGSGPARDRTRIRQWITGTTSKRTDEFVRRFWIALVARSRKVIRCLRLQRGKTWPTTSSCSDIADAHLVLRACRTISTSSAIVGKNVSRSAAADTLEMASTLAFGRALRSLPTLSDRGSSGRASAAKRSRSAAGLPRDPHRRATKEGEFGAVLLQREGRDFAVGPQLMAAPQWPDRHSRRKLMRIGG